MTDEATTPQAEAKDGLRERLARLLGRKYLVVVFLLVAPLVLRCIDLMTESGLLTIWGGIGTVYLGINVTQKAVVKPQPPPDVKKE